MANLNGKKGSKKHQDVQESEFQKTIEEYKEVSEILVKTEVPVQTFNGKKMLRVVDVAAYSTNNENHVDYHKIVQVGKTDKNGEPVKREKEAIEDIEKHAHIKVTFVDYENYKF